MSETEYVEPEEFSVLEQNSGDSRIPLATFGGDYEGNDIYYTAPVFGGNGRALADAAAVAETGEMPELPDDLRVERWGASTGDVVAAALDEWDGSFTKVEPHLYAGDPQDPQERQINALLYEGGDSCRAVMEGLGLFAGLYEGAEVSVQLGFWFSADGLRDRIPLAPLHLGDYQFHGLDEFGYSPRSVSLPGEPREVEVGTSEASVHPFNGNGSAYVTGAGNIAREEIPQQILLSDGEWERVVPYSVAQLSESGFKAHKELGDHNVHSLSQDAYGEVGVDRWPDFVENLTGELDVVVRLRDVAAARRDGAGARNNLLVSSPTELYVQVGGEWYPAPPQNAQSVVLGTDSSLRVIEEDDGMDGLPYCY